jgi:type 1 glutamine amidotransferase
MEMDHEPIRVVILSGQNVHDWKATTPFLEKLYNDSGAFKVVEVVNDVSKITAASFERCDVIVSNWTCHPQMTGGPWTDEGKKAFSDAIRSGKGMVSFHAASTACNDWEDFQEISGLTWKWEFTNHTEYHTFKVLIRDQDHPITKGVPDFWTTDELYQQMVKLAKSDYHLLASAWSEKQFGGISKTQPMLITTQLGKGRGVNLLLGHDVRAMSNPAFKTIMLRSTEWAATSKVTIPIPADWPGCAPAAAIVGVDVQAAMKAATQYSWGQAYVPLYTVEQAVTAAHSRTDPTAGAGRARLAAELAGALGQCQTGEAKSFFCKQLANIGTTDQVPAVAPLLLDEATNTMARFALERIPGPTAAKALRDALPQAKGMPRIGIVNSLGNKADADSAGVLEPLLKDPDPVMAEAASAALAKIRTVPAPAYQWRRGDSSVALLNGETIVWQFNFAKDGGYPYFHPLNLTDGTELVWLSPPDHVHHRGLWFAWKMLNGVNYWEHDPKGGLTEVTDAKVTSNPDFSARIELAISYHPVDQPPVMTEKRIIEITPPAADGSYYIDWNATFTAGPSNIEMKGGTAGGGYAGLGARIAKDSSQWLLINSEGRRADQPTADGFPLGLHGQHARWADFSFLSPVTGSLAGIAIFDHPSNFRFPSQWHDWMDWNLPAGYLSPAPLWSQPYTLAANKELTLRYRILVHASRPNVDKLNHTFIQ